MNNSGDNNVTNDMTAEIDLSDPINVSGVNGLEEASDDSRETTPMFMTPRSNSRVVRIISKQSNV